ncbi:hypothetical protein H6F67_04775 [Microcoleus sp. FACHB-1515]|uniref:hypothetical protein n=1 Tax=Cyanophyceae TaxID=3028117 RepID=UPI0016890BFA|nr:hypothetical protein [Microcoleus sp. FACHB-1515]MBD2089166.1 hypothetical protein [Microcoleus sp. FACHB-1515]
MSVSALECYTLLMELCEVALAWAALTGHPSGRTVSRHPLRNSAAALISAVCEM